MEYGQFKKREGGGFRDNRDRGVFQPRDRDNRDRGDFQPRDRDNRDRGGFQPRDRDFRDRGERDDRDESVYSQKVRAGKRRTYFFDVRTTKGDDYFITITESTRREDGFGYKRHKLFLYKEDFNRFIATLTDVVDHVKTTLMPDFDYEEFDRRQAEWEAQNKENEMDADYDRFSDSTEEKRPFKEDDDISW